jgi:hypothetical protein
MLRNNTLRDDSAPEQISESAELRREHVIAAAVMAMNIACDDPEVTQQLGLVPDVYNTVELAQTNLDSTRTTPNVVSLPRDAIIDPTAPQASITGMAA